jgi:hypothetical protein
MPPVNPVNSDEDLSGRILGALKKAERERMTSFASSFD